MARQFPTARTMLQLALAASTAVGAWLLAPALDEEGERLVFSVEFCACPDDAARQSPASRRAFGTPARRRRAVAAAAGAGGTR